MLVNTLKGLLKKKKITKSCPAQKILADYAQGTIKACKVPFRTRSHHLRNKVKLGGRLRSCSGVRIRISMLFVAAVTEWNKTLSRDRKTGRTALRLSFFRICFLMFHKRTSCDQVILTGANTLDQRFSTFLVPRFP